MVYGEAMKVFISADMEGVAAVASREEVTKGEADYTPAQRQMTNEVVAACEGALAAGATEVWIKDAHWTGRNIDPERLPPQARLVRGWSGHPFSMVQGLDSGFAGVMMVGYHSAAGRGGNPLAHTLSGRLIGKIEINGEVASEFLIYSYAAAMVGVPVWVLTGDGDLCREALRRNETLRTVAVFEGQGASIVALPPLEATARIRREAETAVRERKGRVLPLAERFDTRVEFKDPTEAFRRSFYPGARLEDHRAVRFETPDYFEVLRFLQFMTH